MPTMTKADIRLKDSHHTSSEFATLSPQPTVDIPMSVSATTPRHTDLSIR